MSGFLDALPFTLEMEGGFTVDTGGPTNRGVTQETFSRWLALTDQPDRDVRTITDDEVQAVYHRLYWVPAGCEKLWWPLSMVHFDCAVNTGVRRAIRILQRAVWAKDDGIWGDETMDAVSRQDHTALFNNLLWHRCEFYYQLGQRERYRPYFLGWIRRVLKLREHARSVW